MNPPFDDEPSLPRASTSVMPVTPIASSGLGRGLAAMSSELSLLFDPLCIAAAAVLAPTLAGATPYGDDLVQAAAVSAVAAALILHDPRFGTLVLQDLAHRLVRSHALRFAALAAALLALGAIGPVFDGLGPGLLAAWAAASLVATSLARVLVARALRSLQRRGAFAERVVVVGNGACLERVLHALHGSRPHTIELSGVFDDSAASPGPPLAGLIRLGQERRIDWILLALPADSPDAAVRLASLLLRLKALSVPIGLCSGDTAGLPQPVAGVAPRRVLSFDAHDLASFTVVARRFGVQAYGFAVTPNVDHLIRLDESAAFRELYAAADYILLDSRFLARLMRVTRGLHLPVCTGSDLVATLLREVVDADDPLVLIGGSDAQAHTLAALHGLSRLSHFNPPMGFIHDPAAVEDCLRFIEAHSPFRYCLLAVGAPQQEMLARMLKARGQARGLALCIGASINFLTGDERRAPHWMQQAGLEWSFRLMRDPRRLAGRYLVRGPRVFALLRRAEIVLRPSTAIGAAMDSAGSVGPGRLQAPLLVETVAAVEPAFAEQDQRLVVVVGGGA